MEEEDAECCPTCEFCYCAVHLVDRGKAKTLEEALERVRESVR